MAGQAEVKHKGGSEYEFKLGPLTPGTYFLDVWKDLNGDGFANLGDFYGAYTTASCAPQPIQVFQGKTTEVCLVYLPQTCAYGLLGKWEVHY